MSTIVVLAKYSTETTFNSILAYIQCTQIAYLSNAAGTYVRFLSEKATKFEIVSP
jgi:hypothetical protein